VTVQKPCGGYASALAMETVMQARLAIFSAAALAAAASAAPEAAKLPVGTAPQVDRPAAVLASADHVRAPAQPAEAPKKPRAARVTTCRCGEQVAAPADDPKDR
jgi:hypothetical protein